VIKHIVIGPKKRGGYGVNDLIHTSESPFADLPAAMVEEVLEQTSLASELLIETFHQVKDQRAVRRKQLLDARVIVNESKYGYPPLPTTCATDGSYAVERLLTTDLAAAAAVAVEGLTPPSEKRYWDQPRHSTFVRAEVHHTDTTTVLRAVMLGNELLLATRAPHDLVMLDATLTLPIIYFNQALNKAPVTTFLHCSREFLMHCVDYLEAYLAILQSQRTDKNYAALPKYSTRREIGQEMNWPGEYDDRGILTLLLQPGELTEPRNLEEPDGEWHLNTSLKSDLISEKQRKQANELAAEIIAQIKEIRVFYYKPQEWLPALRVEASQNIVTNHHRLASVLHGIKHQCATPAMLEPYPLYLADRTVKALARSVPAFRQVTTQRISERYAGDIGEVFFAMHGYRSEAGR
jgi:hypothetical protein